MGGFSFGALKRSRLVFRDSRIIFYNREISSAQSFCPFSERASRATKELPRVATRWFWARSASNNAILRAFSIIF
jgi:hypothetical protein